LRCWPRHQKNNGGLPAVSPDAASAVSFSPLLDKTPYNDSNRVSLLRKPSHDAKSGLVIAAIGGLAWLIATAFFAAGGTATNMTLQAVNQGFAG